MTVFSLMFSLLLGFWGAGHASAGPAAHAIPHVAAPMGDHGGMPLASAQPKGDSGPAPLGSATVQGDHSGMPL